MPRRASLVAAALAAITAAPAFADGCGDLAGRYFFEVENAALAAALKAALGEASARFDDRYQVQVPFERTEDGYVYAPACMPHSCTVNEAFLGVEEATCDVFVAIIENRTLTFVAPKTGWPASLESVRKAWVNRQL